MNSNEFLVKVIFYTKKRYIGHEFFQKNITLYEIKQYYKQNFYDGTTILFKNYYLNSTMVIDSDIISNIIQPSPNILEISIALELREVEELKHQFSLIKFDDENDHVYSQIIKPKINPFGLIVFLTKNSSIQIEQYPPEIIKKYNLEKFNKNYAYCNSPNYLFLSGENNFWIINKKNYFITQLKLKISKIKHSLCHVPNIGVFAIGGETKKTFLYDIQSKKFKKWGDTNNYHNKPALIYYEEYLYSFQQLNKKNKFFEKTYLGENTQKKWEIIYPRFKDIDPNEFYNRNFAVSKSTGGKILLIGGNKSYKNTYIFNPLNDTIIKTEGENEKINFDEKIFYKLNKVINIAIPSDFEKSNELAILNKYLYTLQKYKYKKAQKDININYDFNLENNLELINDNKIGNFSIQLKFGGMDYGKEKMTVLRTLGIPVFSQLNYIKFTQQFQKCICPSIIKHGSHINILKNNIALKKEKILKRNYSQRVITIQYNENIINENKKDKKFDNNQKEKKEKKSKNIISIMHQKNYLEFNKEIKYNIKNDTKQNKEKNDEKTIEIKPIIEKENNLIKAKEQKYEQTLEIKKEEINIEDKKIEKKQENIDNNEKKEEKKIMENKTDNEEKKIIVKESIIISEKQDNKHDDTYDNFSNIKEIRGKLNYDMDETKTNKNLYESNAANFQLKESIQRDYNPTKFYITSNEKSISNEKKQNSENNFQNLENIKIKENMGEMNYNQNIEQNKDQNKETEDINKIQFEPEKSKINNENQVEEVKIENEINDKGEFEEIQKEDEQIDQQKEQEEEKLGQFEELSEKKEEQENEFEHQNSFEKEINEQEVHEDFEPNKIIDIKKRMNISQKESNIDKGLYKENIEDNMAQDIDEDNECENDNYDDQDENIINYEQNDKDLSEDNFNNPNEGLFTEIEGMENENNNIKNLKEEIHINKYNLNFDGRVNNKINILEKKVIKNESDLNINFHQEESRELGIEDNNQSKTDKITSTNINKEKIPEDSTKKRKKEEKIKNFDNIEQNFVIEKNKSIETQKGEIGEFQEEENEEYNQEEEVEEQENLGDEEINTEENEERQMMEENEERQMMEENEEGQMMEENEYEKHIYGMSYEPDEIEDYKEKGRDSIIHISDDEHLNHEDTNTNEEKNLQKYQKFVKNIEYDQPNE